jgi:phage terminase large subunit-like protein
MLAHDIRGIPSGQSRRREGSRAAAVSPLIEAGNVFLPHLLLARGERLN